MSFKVGEYVAVPATVAPGPFSGEFLVTFKTASGEISGFVRDRDFVEREKTVQGVVQGSTPETLSVMLSGSYFTTNGYAEFPAGWARKHVKAVA